MKDEEVEEGGRGGEGEFGGGGEGVGGYAIRQRKAEVGGRLWLKRR